MLDVGRGIMRSHRWSHQPMSLTITALNGKQKQNKNHEMPHTLLQLSVILIYKSLFLHFSSQEKYDLIMTSSTELPHLYL
jgi:hypothetical protein